jgi:hypothetical protein
MVETTARRIAMAEMDLREIGARGLVVFDGENYQFVQEHKWRERGPVKKESEQTEQLRAFGVIVARLDDGIYIDLDKLIGLEESEGDIKSGPAQFALAHEPRSVLFRHETKLFQVPESDWIELDDGFEGAAGVVVTRGAVVAAVGQNSIPSGTYCVVVNLPQILGAT